jgi:hypothetical protein
VEFLLKAALFIIAAFLLFGIQSVYALFWRPKVTEKEEYPDA